MVGVRFLRPCRDGLPSLPEGAAVNPNSKKDKKAWKETILTHHCVICKSKGGGVTFRKSRNGYMCEPCFFDPNNMKLR